MAIAFVQANEATPVSSTSNSVAFSSSNTPGNFLVVCSNQNASNTLAVSDTLGNIFTPIAGPASNASLVTCMWYVPNCKAGANTITISSTGGGYIQIGALEYSGIAGSNPADVNTSNNATSGTALSTGTTGTTAVPVELVIACFAAANGGISLPAGYTNRIGADSYFKVDELITSSIGTQSASTTGNAGAWTGQIATFQPAAVAPTHSFMMMGVGV